VGLGADHHVIITYQTSIVKKKVKILCIVLKEPRGGVSKLPKWQPWARKKSSLIPQRSGILSRYKVQKHFTLKKVKTILYSNVARCPRVKKQARISLAFPTFMEALRISPTQEAQWVTLPHLLVYYYTIEKVKSQVKM